MSEFPQTIMDMTTKASSDAELVGRYSRQMLVPSMNGLVGQRELRDSSVLVVGAGGIGSTAILYLAGAGVGKMGIVDFDHVEISNLHRQVIYRMDEVGMSKATCAARRVQALNPEVVVVPFELKLSYDNALDIVSQFDLVVDATDNFKVRYIINDACVFLNKPLISGAAVGLEGQVTVFLPGRGCYRCLYPRPSAAEASRSCANAGVLGPVPGVIGCLEAIEAIKLITLWSIDKEAAAGIPASKKLSVLSGTQAYMDAASGSFYNFELPPRNPACPICGDHKSIITMTDAEQSLPQDLCPGTRVSTAPVAGRLPEQHEIQALCYFNEILQKDVPHVLIDVRNPVQYKMINLESYFSSRPGAKYVHMPLIALRGSGGSMDVVMNCVQEVLQTADSSAPGVDVYVLCRRGVDSVSATEHLIELLSADAAPSKPCRIGVKNVTGGLVAWSDFVDNKFPKY